VSPAVAEWVRVADESALHESLGVDVGGHPIALFRLEDGVYALDDICSHEYSRLSEGEIWAGEVYCVKHGSRFDIKSGAVSGLPATLPVRSYPVRVEGGGIFVLWGPGS
jgi:3-phenylpropionate/trans-cinnamate dioxygenase ferredoxin subunit